MRLSHVNYRRQETSCRKLNIVNVGFFAYEVPRPVLLCRMFGHRPTVDGIAASKWSPTVLWVCCDRCGCRGEPQGRLDPGQWKVGDRYAGDWRDPLPTDRREKQSALESLKVSEHYSPGPIPTGPTFDPSGQLLIGGGRIGPAVELKIGNCGSENKLGLMVSAGWLGSLHLGSGRFGTWWQRRLNPDGYDSRVIGLALRRGVLSWSLWARKNETSPADPWWMHGAVSLRLIDRVLTAMYGRRQYHYEVRGESARFVKLPEGDYLVRLKLERAWHGRRGLKRRTQQSWAVDWSAAGRGLPTEAPEDGRMFGGGVTVTDVSARNGTWASEAAAAIAYDIVKLRSREGWDSIEPAATARPVAVTA
jgi:hypothetical protein